MRTPLDAWIPDAGLVLLAEIRAECVARVGVRADRAAKLVNAARAAHRRDRWRVVCERSGVDVERVTPAELAVSFERE